MDYQLFVGKNVKVDPDPEAIKKVVLENMSYFDHEGFLLEIDVVPDEVDLFGVEEDIKNWVVNFFRFKDELNQKFLELRLTIENGKVSDYDVESVYIPR